MESSNYKITDWCTISNGKVCHQGTVVFENVEGDFTEFAKAFYKYLNISYPKFFKMDSLSKLAFLGSEIILGKQNTGEPKSDIAVLFSNASGSLDTDYKHSQTIVDASNYYPSPALFVYTLANICLAEVSIRHKIQGENTFFITPTFDVDLMYTNASYILKSNRANKVLCGWVEYLNDNYQLHLYQVEQNSDTGIEHTKENITNLYHT